MTEELRPEQIPLIDLEAFAAGDRSQVERADRSLREHNFVALENHGVDERLIAKGYDAGRRLFALPQSVKRRYSKGKGAIGFIPYGVEQALIGKHPDLKELWHHAHEPEDPAVVARFPDAYPTNHSVAEVPQWGDTMRALDAAFARATDRLMRVLALAIGLPEGHFVALTHGAPHMLRIVYYPPLPGRLRPGEARAVAHTGAGVLGLLPPATDPGLEIQRRDGRWQSLVGFDRQIVITIADQMARLSGGRIVGSTHRVINPSGEAAGRPRYALVYFVSSMPDTVLVPPPGLEGAVAPEETITSWEFMTRRMQKVWINQASLPYRLLWRLRERLAR